MLTWMDKFGHSPSLAGTNGDNGDMVKVTVGAPTHPVSERLYGVFFEDINYGADGGLNANMVNNYSFDGVYLDHRSLRVRGNRRWRTLPDPLRFWTFEGASARSCGTWIRGGHGQRVATECPAPPLHDNSRFVRLTVNGSAARVENPGYNGESADSVVCAMSIVTGHAYEFSAYARAVVGRIALRVSVVDRYGLPLTDTLTFRCGADGDGDGNLGGMDDDDRDGCGGDGAMVNEPAGNGRDRTASGDSDDGDRNRSTAAADPLEHDGWHRISGTLTGLGTDYGKLRIDIMRGTPPRQGGGAGTAIADGDGDIAARGRSTMPRGGAAIRHDDNAILRRGGNAVVPAAAAVCDLDCVSLMDADYWGRNDPKWRFGKLRRDLVEAIADLNPSFVRFPGGCIVEGVTPGNEYRWKDTVGALPARRQQYSIWGFRAADGSSYSQSYQIGFYEYFCLCEDLHAKPLPTLFAGITCQSPYRDPRHIDTDSEYFRNTVIQDYLDLIDFANGDPATSAWARVRADMGHPEPFGLDMIGVGNENYGPDYVEKYDAICRAVHAKDPSMLCVMSAGLFPFRAPMRRSWDHARDVARGMAGQTGHERRQTGVATTSDAGPADAVAAGEAAGETTAVGDVPAGVGAMDSATGDAIIVDEHSYHSPEWFISQAGRFDEYPRCGAGVYFGEYSANGYFAGQRQTYETACRWDSALAEAAFLTGCERNSDVVRMTSYAPLLAHITGKGWQQNLIEFNPAHVNPTVNYEVQRLFAANLGPLAYECEIDDENGRRLFVSATGDEGIGRFVKIVNIEDSPVHITLDIALGLRALGSVEESPLQLRVETLSGSPQAKNTLAYTGPARTGIRHRTNEYRLSPGPVHIALALQPSSVTLITLHPATPVDPVVTARHA